MDIILWIVVILLLTGGVAWACLNIRNVDAAVILAFSSLIVVPIASIVMLIPLTTGVGATYAEGERIGYVTKISRKGLIFKTWEGQLQIGAGEMAALQEPWNFSVRNKEIVDKLAAAQDGRRVKLVYRQWIIQPWRYGGTQYEILDVQESRLNP